MIKRVLVHECGYVVNKGDELALHGRPDDMYSFRFSELGGVNGSRIIVNVRTKEFTCTMVYEPKDFNCSIMEIDDESTV